MRDFVTVQCECGATYRMARDLALLRRAASKPPKCRHCGRRVTPGASDRAQTAAGRSGGFGWRAVAIALGCAGAMVVAVLVLFAGGSDRPGANQETTPPVVAEMASEIAPHFSREAAPAIPARESKETRLAAWPAPLPVPSVLPAAEMPRHWKDHPRNLHYDAAPVAMMAVSPNGRYLAAAGAPPWDDVELVLWDLDARQPAWIKSFGPGRAAIAFSPDSRTLAVVSEEGLVLLGTEDGTPASTTPHEGLRSIAFSPDGTVLAGIHDDSRIEIRDAGTGRILRTMNAAEGGMRSGVFHWPTVAIDASSRYALSLTAGIVRRRDMSSGRTTSLFALPFRPFTCSAFAPRSGLFAAAGWETTDSGSEVVVARAGSVEVGIWRVATGERLATFEAGALRVDSLAFAPDEQSIALGLQDGTVQFRGIGSDEPPQTLRPHTSSVRGVAFLPDGKSVITAGDDKQIKVWEFEGPEPPAEPAAVLSRLDPRNPDQPRSILEVAVSPNGRSVCSSHQDGTVRLRNARNGEVTHILPGHAEASSPIVFTADGARVIAARPDGSLIAWDVATGDESGRFDTPGSATLKLAASADGKWLASADSAGRIRLRDPTTLAPVSEIALPAVSALAIAHDGSLLSAGGPDGLVRIYSIPGLQEHTVVGRPGQGIAAVEFAPDAKRLAIGRLGGAAEIWQLEPAGQEPLTLSSPDGLGDSPLSLSYTPDGAIIAGGTNAGRILFWDSQTGAHLQSLHAHMGPASSVAFGRGGSWVISGGIDGALRRWEPDSAATQVSRLPFGPVAISSPGSNCRYETAKDSGAETIAMTSAGEIAEIVIGPVPLQRERTHSAIGELKLEPAADPERMDDAPTAAVQLAYYDSSGHRVASVDPGPLTAGGAGWQTAAVRQDPSAVPEHARFVAATVRLTGACRATLRSLELFSSGEPSAPDNLLHDGSFENYAGPTVAGWWLNSRGDPAASMAPTAVSPVHGRHCLELRGNGEWVEAHAAARFSPESGRGYVLTGNVRTVKGTAGLQIHYWNERSQHLGKTAVPALATSDWTKMSVVSEVEKYPETAAISVSVIGRGEVEARYDDLRFTSISPSAARELATRAQTAPPPVRSGWSLAHDDTAEVEFEEVRRGDANSVLQLRGNCRWAVVSRRDKIAVAPGRSYVLTGFARRERGEAMIKIDYYQETKHLGSTYSKPAGGAWEELAAESQLAKYPQATHLGVAAVGRGNVEAQFRDLELKQR